MTDIKKETKESCWRKMFVPKTDGDFWPRAFRGTVCLPSAGCSIVRSSPVSLSVLFSVL